MTSGADDLSQPRAGSTQDVVRRMDRMEQKHEDLAREVGVLSSTVARVEQNQTHAAELNKLRFDSLDSGLKSVSSQLTEFMRRIEALISGETQTAQSAQMLAEYTKFREDTETRLDAQDVLNGQVKLLGRLAVILVGGNAIAIIAAVYAAIK